MSEANLPEGIPKAKKKRKKSLKSVRLLRTYEKTSQTT